MASSPASLLLAAVRDLDTESGNPWHDPKTGQFANAPPGLRMLHGGHLFGAIKDKMAIESMRRGTPANAIAAYRTKPGLAEVHLFNGTHLVNKTWVELDEEKLARVSRTRARSISQAPEPPDVGMVITNDLGEEVTVTADVEEAVRLLGEGRKVELHSVDQVAILLDKLANIAADAKRKGERAPNYDLCHITVKGTNIFCVESKGIPRIQMPQLKGEPIEGSRGWEMANDPDIEDVYYDDRGEVELTGKFIEYLEEQGIIVHNDTALASHLKATQNELNGIKVAGMMKFLDGGGVFDTPYPFLVSHDNYVVDGHHRWASTVGHDLSQHGGDLPGEFDLTMEVARVEADIIDLLDLANRFAAEWGIPQSSAQNTDKDLANAAVQAPESETDPDVAEAIVPGSPIYDSDRLNERMYKGQKVTLVGTRSSDGAQLIRMPDGKLKHVSPRSLTTGYEDEWAGLRDDIDMTYDDAKRIQAGQKPERKKGRANRVNPGEAPDYESLAAALVEIRAARGAHDAKLLRMAREIIRATGGVGMGNVKRVIMDPLYWGDSNALGAYAGWDGTLAVSNRVYNDMVDWLNTKPNDREIDDPIEYNNHGDHMLLLIHEAIHFQVKQRHKQAHQYVKREGSALEEGVVETLARHHTRKINGDSSSLSYHAEVNWVQSNIVGPAVEALSSDSRMLYSDAIDLVMQKLTEIHANEYNTVRRLKAINGWLKSVGATPLGRIAVETMGHQRFGNRQTGLTGRQITNIINVQPTVDFGRTGWWNDPGMEAS